jgi:FkbM family methyltransferase
MKLLKSSVKALARSSGYSIIRDGELDSLREGQVDAHSLRLRLFRQLANKGFRPTHIIDVGAHKGDWSRDAHRFFPDCAFTLIEPQVEMKPDLDRFCSEAKNARWILAGAGASVGELALTVRPEDPDGSSFAFSEEEARRRGFERRVVPLVTLDSVCEGSNLPPPEVVKIDAEGFESEVMRGSRTLIGATELFFIEVNTTDWTSPQSLDFLDRMIDMRQHGYEFYDITDLNRRPSDGAVALMEVAFAKRSGVLRGPSFGWQ